MRLRICNASATQQSAEDEDGSREVEAAPSRVVWLECGAWRESLGPLVGGLVL